MPRGFLFDLDGTLVDSERETAEAMARAIERGIYHFPLPTKQGSISAAHTQADVDETLAATKEVVATLK